jgi:hypothetical protein
MATPVTDPNVLKFEAAVHIIDTLWPASEPNKDRVLAWLQLALENLKDPSAPVRVCRRCSTAFRIDAREAEYIRKKEWRLPKFCPVCRAQRRREMEAAGQVSHVPE